MTIIVVYSPDSPKLLCNLLDMFGPNKLFLHKKHERLRTYNYIFIFSSYFILHKYLKREYFVVPSDYHKKLGGLDTGSR